MTAVAARAARLHQKVAELVSPPAVPFGRVRAHDGAIATIHGVAAGTGALLRLETAAAEPVPAEVIGFRGDELLAMPLGRGAIAPGARALLAGRADRVEVGAAILGRVVDALGIPLDGGPPPAPGTFWPLGGRSLPPLDRADVAEPVETGVRAIDALFTLGRGQRIGLIAGSGVGKSVLLQQLVRGAAADVVVAALVGERGREIGGFVGALDPGTRARTHIVAVPADQPAPLRLRGALRAAAVAEWVRSQGGHALLLVDSLTRVAHAQRELGLAVGEPAGARGYPASALALIPKLVERAGNDAATGGAVTAVFTVLADGDDTIADPVVDTARGVLDGHLILSRDLAARGRFPAIDLALSLSRTMAATVPADQVAAARRLRADSARIEGARDLLAMGAYAPGADPALDRALARDRAIEAFVCQPATLFHPFAASVAALVEGWPE
jgi:flagellum-specific ATP synthase